MGYQMCNGATDTRVECSQRLVLIVCARALGQVLLTEWGEAWREDNRTRFAENWSSEWA